VLLSPVVKAWHLGSARAEAMVIIRVAVILMVAAGSAKIVRLMDRLLSRVGKGYSMLCLVVYVNEIWWLGERDRIDRKVMFFE
jgi:hypothetical protein